MSQLWILQIFILCILSDSTCVPSIDVIDVLFGDFGYFLVTVFL